MKLAWTKKLCAIFVTVCMLLSVLPTIGMAADGKLTLEFIPVTEDDTTTLAGEAKVMVRIKGAEGTFMMTNLAIRFDGMQYKTIEFLLDGTAPVAPNTAYANATGKLELALIDVANPTQYEDETDVCILTFEKTEEDTTLELTLDTANSYLQKNLSTSTAKEFNAAHKEGIAASTTSNTGVDAVVQLTMDKVRGFVGATQSGYSDTGITLTITSDTDSDYGYSTVLNNTPTDEGGHRFNADSNLIVFRAAMKLLGGQTYTVKLSGLGYCDFERSGIDFSSALILTNSDFKPGDVNLDGKVEYADRLLVEAAAQDADEAETLGQRGDFTRDGAINSMDVLVYDDLGITEAPQQPTANAPAKMAAPTVTGGKKQITVSWTAPADNGSAITGYTIKYGTSESNLNMTKSVTDAAATSTTVSSLSADTTYYVSIAAINAVGTGEASATASAKTNAEENAGGGGSTVVTPSEPAGGSNGGSTGGSTGSGGASTPSTPTTPVQPVVTKTFTDMSAHTWAEDAVYALKEKGIISGTSETTFSPANQIKRGDFILILTRMLGVNNSFEANFADVPAGSYYYSAIGAAKAAGIATGDGTNFMPENSITRQDLIVLAYRAFVGAGYIAETDDLSVLDQFADKGDIAGYAQAAMASMVKAGIIQGSDIGVNPLGYATRAEVAVMCNRMLALMQ